MGAEVDVKRLTPAHNFALGGLAGTIEVRHAFPFSRPSLLLFCENCRHSCVVSRSCFLQVVMLQPMLYCKNATQQGIPLTLDPRVLYRGVGVSIGNMVVLTGLQFPLTGAVAKTITGGVDRPLGKSEKIASGFAGGAISGFVCAPMELVMIQQQRFGTSMLNAAARIVQEKGPLGLFRGLETSCGREGLFAAGYLGMGPVFAEQLRANYGMGGSADFAGAVGAGLIAATLSHPLDTIKTCMQGDIERATYTTTAGTASKILQDGGYGFFFRGWAFRCAGTLTRHIPVPARSNTLPCVLVRPLRASLTDDVHHRLSVSLWPQDVTDDLRDMAHRAGEKPRCANPLSVRAQGEHGGKVLMLCNTYRTRAFNTVRLTDLARAGHHLAQTGRNRGRLGRHARTGCGGPPSASACLLASAPRAFHCYVRVHPPAARASPVRR